MPWKECSVMDERMQFVEFGISRKTGYKIFDRYQECGIHALTDRSRRPYRYANQLPFQVENYILNVKREHSSWGARKIRERLTRRFAAYSHPCEEHHPCGAGSPRPGGAPRSHPSSCSGNRFVDSRNVPTNCGVPTTKANSCWEITNTAIRSR